MDGIFKKICNEASKTKKFSVIIEKDETELTLDFFEENYNSLVEKLPSQSENYSKYELQTPTAYKFWLFKI